MKKEFWILAFCLAWLATSCSQNIRIACVGDSITEGYGLKHQSETSYPVKLDSILGPKFDVLNSGRSATTLQKKGDFSYWTCKEFSNTFAYKPNIIIVKLGTNDTKPRNWNENAFKKDFQALIDTFKTISTHPEIYLCKPVPAFKTVWGINDSIIKNKIIPAIDILAKANNLPTIDLYTYMQNQGMNFPDSIHPNEKAAEVMANIIANSIRK